MTYKKEYNAARKRNISSNIQMTEEEHDQLKAICKELEISKVQFVLNAMEQYNKQK